LSTVSLGELRSGIDRLPSSPKKHDLLLWLIALTERYSGRFLDFDTESAFTWGALTASLAGMGKPMPTIDAMVAACVLRRGYTLVTRNERDYQNAGVPLVNPWSC
jgi:predicted nucleic acid-binding protein